MRAALSRHCGRRGLRVGALIAAAAAAALFIPAVSATAQTATSDTSPVNLSSSIDMADGKAQAAATVAEGDARFEVLTPEVIRMEYSPAGCSARCHREPPRTSPRPGAGSARSARPARPARPA
jgi:hypothetical protein